MPPPSAPHPVSGTVVGVLLCGAAASCLPGDHRPEPGSLLVTAEPTAAIVEGFTTDDGWAIRFDRFVTAVGDVRLRDIPEGPDDSCQDYAETYYEWLFDFTVAEREKVGLVFGLGQCNVEFRVRAPSGDTVVGPGVTEADVASMRVEASDAFGEEEEGTAVRMSGQAERGGVVKRFDWWLRRDQEIEECEGLVEGVPPGSLVTLVGGERRELRIFIRGEELFRVADDDDAPFQFGAYAAADLDGDGTVALEELAGVAPPSYQPAGDPLVVAVVDADAPAVEEPGDEEQPTLGDLLYDVLLPRVGRPEGAGACTTDDD